MSASETAISFSWAHPASDPMRQHAASVMTDFRMIMDFSIK
jgi:hypothetical protein